MILKMIPTMFMYNIHFKKEYASPELSEIVALELIVTEAILSVGFGGI